LKAICLWSGGLDSQLAVCLMQEQGIEVIGVNFASPFFGANKAAQQAAEKLGIKLHVIDISKEYVNTVLKNPVYGYGKNLNPCIDCHAYMLKKAGDYMPEVGASFLITGEVLGQRPMSQNKSSLNLVDKLSGYRGLIVRPLSARLLPPTVPETEGWINRDQMLDISGRSRTRQMELALKYGIEKYPSPAGGCLLTEEAFSRRIKPFLHSEDELDPNLLELIKVGRLFIINENYLLIVGRKQAENERLQEIAASQDYLLKVVNRPGPLGVIRVLRGTLSAQDLDYAASIVARYSDAKNDPETTVRVTCLNGTIDKTLNIKPLSPEHVPSTV